MNVLGSEIIQPGATGQQPSRPANVLTGAALFWLAVFLLGQLAFFYYLVAFYGVTIATNNLAAWNVFKQFGVTSYIPADTIGNFAFGSHALGAAIVAIAGGLQLVPAVRRRLPRFHRINGRIFLLTCVILTLSGLYLVWIRKAPPASFSELTTTLNAALILTCSYFVVRRALARDIKNHSRWAMRLYLVANGQWFLRLGVMCYMALGNLIGTASFTDGFFTYWNYAAFIIPLVVLQLYFCAKDTGQALIKHIVAALLIVLALLMSTGILAQGFLHYKIINGEPLAF
jgi:uncharacterized membrane protein